MSDQNAPQSPIHGTTAHPGPTRGWYALAALLFVIAFASVAFEVRTIARNMGTAVYFLAPGSKTIEVDAPRTYTIWHENRILYNGTTYNAPAAMPAGTTFTVTGPRGESVPVTADGSASTTSGSTESHSLATFHAPVPGSYTLTVGGLPSPRVLSVTKFNFGDVIGTIALCSLLQLIGVPGAMILSGVVAFFRYQARQKSAAVNSRK